MAHVEGKITGFEGTKAECDTILLVIHGMLTSTQQQTDIKYIDATHYGFTIKHPTEDRYFAPIKKKKFPNWEIVIDAVLSVEQAEKYGDMPDEFLGPE